MGLDETRSETPQLPFKGREVLRMRYKCDLYAVFCVQVINMHLFSTIVALYFNQNTTPVISSSLKYFSSL